jgi:hypothetical protein
MFGAAATYLLPAEPSPPASAWTRVRPSSFRRIAGETGGSRSMRQPRLGLRAWACGRCVTQRSPMGEGRAGPPGMHPPGAASAGWR